MLKLTVLLVSVSEAAPPVPAMPPPSLAVLFVTLVSVSVNAPALKMPPPSSVAVLPLMVLVARAADPAGKKKGKPVAAEITIAPPSMAVFPLSVEPVSDREPAATLMAPPELPAAFAVDDGDARDIERCAGEHVEDTVDAAAVDDGGGSRKSAVMVRLLPTSMISRSPVAAAFSLAPARVRV